MNEWSEMRVRALLWALQRQRHQERNRMRLWLQRVEANLDAALALGRLPW